MNKQITLYKDNNNLITVFYDEANEFIDIIRETPGTKYWDAIKIPQEGFADLIKFLQSIEESDKI